MRSQISVGRKTELDALRVLSCFMVICIHVVFQSWNDISPRTFGWQMLNVCNCLVRGCVPVFIMLSGISFLGEEKPIAVLLRKYVLRIAVLFLFWTVLYAIDTVGFKNICCVAGLKNLIFQCFDEKYHLWYLASTIGAYLVLPLLWPVAKRPEHLKYLVIVFLVYASFTFGAQYLPHHKEFMPTVYQIAPAFSNFPALMLVGYYFYHYEPIRKGTGFWLTALILCVALTAALNGYTSYAQNEPDNAAIQNLSLPSILEGICLLHIFKNCSKKFEKHSSVLLYLSSCSLGIYLLHIFALEHLQKYLSFDCAFAPLYLSLPILAVTIFLICLAVVSLLKRIPVVGKWIV